MITTRGLYSVLIRDDLPELKREHKKMQQLRLPLHVITRLVLILLKLNIMHAIIPNKLKCTSFWTHGAIEKKTQMCKLLFGPMPNIRTF